MEQTCKGEKPGDRAQETLQKQGTEAISPIPKAALSVPEGEKQAYSPSTTDPTGTVEPCPEVNAAPATRISPFPYSGPG